MPGDFVDTSGRADSAMWREIDELLAATASAARGAGDAKAFYHVFLKNLAQALGATSGGVWQPVRDGGYQLVSEQRWHSTVGERPDGWPDREWLSNAALRYGPLMLPSSRRTTDLAENPCDEPLLAAGIEDDFGHRLAVVVLIIDSRELAARREQASEVLDAFRELAADYHRRTALKTLLDRQHRQSAFDEFAQRVHRGADADATAFAIVNDGRRLIGCDRVSLVTVDGGQPKTRAVSGVDVVERRGAVVRALEALAVHVATTCERIELDRTAPTNELPIRDIAEAYRDQSLAASLIALPLVQPWRGDDAPAQAFAVVVLEWFNAPIAPPDARDVILEPFQRHAESAFAQALAQERIPWSASWRCVDPWFAAQTSARWKRAYVIAGAIGAAAFLGWLIPAELTVTARGRLQPVERRAIFAPADGVVQEVLAEDAKPVATDQLLLRLDSPALDLEAARIAGELSTAEEQLRSVKAERWSASNGPARREHDASQLAAEEESLMALAASLASQQQLVARQQADLEVRSPIAGKVVTWRAADLLRGRPVARGQELLTVANEAGPWRLEIDIPDREFRQVLAAQQTSEQPLEVSFRLATEANTVFTGQLSKLSGATQARDDAQLVVPAEVTFDRAAAPALRTGAQATAKIHCGQRSIAYVWFHEIWEWLAARVW